MNVSAKKLLASLLVLAWAASLQAADYPPSAGAAPIDGVASAADDKAAAAIDGPVGSMIRSWNSQSGTYFTILDLATPDVIPFVKLFPAGESYIGAGEFVQGFSYMVNQANNVYKVDDDGNIVDQYSATAAPNGESYSGMAVNPNTGDVFAASTNVSNSTLLSFDVASGSAVPIGPIAGAPGVIALSFDSAGNLFAYDIVADRFMQVDPATGNTSNAVDLPFDANFGQGMFFDPESGLMFMFAFNNGSFQAELWSVDTTNPASPVFGFIGVLGSTSPGGLNQLTWGGTDLLVPIEDTIATFKVTKEFTDGSEDEVNITLTCNGGNDMVQTFPISGGDPGVTFTLKNFIDGEPTCEITEEGGPDGYKVIMNGGDGCVFENVRTHPGEYTCEIINRGQAADFTVNKVWVIPNEGGDYVEQDVEVTITCQSKIFGEDAVKIGDGRWQLTGVLGDGDHMTALVKTVKGPARCRAKEKITQSGVDSEDDCGWRNIDPGQSSSCTFTNTVFFEGIPTLGQYGLAILALLTLGVGMVGFRRFV